MEEANNQVTDWEAQWDERQNALDVLDSCDLQQKQARNYDPLPFTLQFPNKQIPNKSISMSMMVPNLKSMVIYLTCLLS